MNDQTKKAPTLSLPEAVRKRPGMYLGEFENGGINHIVYELVANSIDQFLAGKATRVSVSFDGDRIIVSDDGEGLPFNQTSPIPDCNLAEYYLTHQHHTATADGHAPHVHIRIRGVGLAVVNAFTASLRVESSDGNHTWKQSFRQGRPHSNVSCEETKKASGCHFELTLDSEIFGDSQVDRLLLRKDLFELAHFYPGFIIELEGERFVSRLGLLELAYQFYNRRHSSPPAKKFTFEGRQDDIQLSVAAVGEEAEGTRYVSWVNGSASVEGGTHVKSIKAAFDAINWMPEVALVHVLMHDPRFSGPSRDFLVSPEINATIQELIQNSVNEFAVQNGLLVVKV